MKYLAITLSLLVVGLSVSAAPNDATRPLRFLGDRDYPPMSYVEDGTAKGMDVDFGKALAVQLNREARIELVDWGLAQEQLLKGEADGLLGMTVLEERRKQFDFSSPIFVREFGLLVRVGEMGLRGIKDLNGRRVGVTPGGFPRRYLEQRPGVNLVLITNYQDGVDQLAAKTVDAVAADLWVAAFLMERTPAQGITIVPQPFATANAAIAVRKGDTELLRQINAALKELKADGTVDAIRDNWRPEEILFVSRGQMRYVVTLSICGFLLVLIGILVFWVFTLKRQVRIREEAEQALRASEERFQLAMRGTADGLWDWNVLTNEAFHSDRLGELLGYGKGEFPNFFASFESHLHPEDQERILGALNSHLKERVPYDAELRLRTKSGEYRWFRARGQAVWDNDGRALRMAGSITDITQSRKAEEAVRHSEELFRAIVEDQTEMIVRWKPDGTRTFVNAAYCRVFGGTPEQFVGVSFLPLVSEVDRDAVRARIASLTPAHPVSSDIHQSLSPGGGWLWQEWTDRAIFDKHGKIVELQSTGRDITERKCAEDALRENQRVLSTLLSNLPGVVYRCQNEPLWKMEFISEGCRELTGYLPEDFIGSRVSYGELVHPEDRQLLWNAVQAAVRERSFFEHSYRLRTRDGGEKWVWERGLGIFDLDGNFLALEGFITDITARRLAERERAEALQRVQQAREEFTRQLLTAQERERQRLASELHDSLGQNLSIVKNRLHFARQIPGVPDAAMAHLDAIERVTAGAIAETRSLARNLRPLHIDQIGLTDSLKGLIQEVSQSTDIHFERRVEPLDDVLRGEAATHVYRILQEALNNMVKHSRAAHACITVERDVRTVRLSIQDDGVGFDLQQRHGGLGLTSLNERARMLDGTMVIESSPGKGTRLEFQIPITEPEAPE